MTEDDARQHAIPQLAEESPDFKAGEWVLNGVEEYDSAWAFSYNTRKYVETMDERDSLAGNGALVIPKNGAAPWFAWSGADTASQVAQGRPAL